RARAEPDLRGRRLPRPAGDRARLQYRGAEDRQVGPERRWILAVAALGSAPRRRPRGALPLGIGDPDAALLPHAELRVAADRALLREPVLRLRGARARAVHGGRGRRAEADVSARDRDLRDLDRGRLSHRDGLAALGAAAVADLDHLWRQPGDHEG